MDKEKPGPINPTMEEEEEEEERVGVAKGNRRTRQIESSSGSDNDEGQEKAEEPASRASSPLNSSPVSQSRRKSRIQRAESSEGEDGQELPDIPRQVLHSDSSEDEGVDDPNPAPRKNISASSDSSDVDTAVHDKKGRARQRKQADNKKRASRKSKAAAMLEIHAESSRMLR